MLSDNNSSSLLSAISLFSLSEFVGTTVLASSSLVTNAISLSNAGVVIASVSWFVRSVLVGAISLGSFLIASTFSVLSFSFGVTSVLAASTSSPSLMMSTFLVTLPSRKEKSPLKIETSLSFAALKSKLYETVKFSSGGKAIHTNFPLFFIKLKMAPLKLPSVILAPNEVNS